MKQSIKIFVEEEYGYRNWLWTFYGTKQELIEAWSNGFVPLQNNCIGYFVKRMGLRESNPVCEPRYGLKPQSECNGTIKGLYGSQGAVISRRKAKAIKIFAHIHEPEDSYLKVDGVKYNWTAK